MASVESLLRAKPVHSVSIVIPVYNEEGNLPTLIQRLDAVVRLIDLPTEVIFVDDGSRDSSATLLLERVERDPLSARVILLNRNYGQHAAIMAGFAHARGDVVVTIDADLQNPPEEIPKLVSKLREGYDVVGSVRTDRHDTWFRKRASALVNLAARKATGVEMHDYGCMLRAYDRRIIEAILQCPERSTFIPVLANSFARRVTEVEVDHSSRFAGDSKYDIWKLINLQFDLLTGITTFPLRLLSVFGAVISTFGICFGLLLLALRILHGSAWAGDGVFTLFAVLFILVGAQFVGMGLLGEYLGRVYHDVRGRPKFFIELVRGTGLTDLVAQNEVDTRVGERGAANRVQTH